MAAVLAGAAALARADDPAAGGDDNFMGAPISCDQVRCRTGTPHWHTRTCPSTSANTATSAALPSLPPQSQSSPPPIGR